MTTRHQQYYSLSLSLLSPVHVATGDAMAPGDYLIYQDMLYELGRWGLSRHLNPAQREELLKILEAKNSDLLQEVQRFLSREAGNLYGAAERATPFYSGILSYYKARLGESMQTSNDVEDSDVINKLELMRHTGAEFGYPYIPGSSLKGAIRGALLNVLNQGRKPSVELQEESEAPRWQGNKEEQRLLGYQGIPRDPFRGLLVGDAVNQQTPVELDYLLVNRLYIDPASKGKKETALEIAPVECVAALQSNALSLNLRLQLQAMGESKLKTLLTDFSTMAQRVNAITTAEFKEQLNWL